MDTDEIWQSRLQKSLEAVRSWESRMNNLDEIDPRSSLHKDDEGLPSEPVRSAAWYGIVTAVDHLALFADLSEKLTLRPSSLFTVTRAALLGASQAVWVLSGSRDDRRLRSLSVASDEHRNHRTFLNDYANDPFVKQHDSHLTADLEGLATKLTTQIESLDKLRKGNDYNGNFRSTRMMSEAAAHLSAQPGTNEWLRLALGYEWRMASAAAHARSWPMHVRTTEREPLPEGREIRRMSASLSEVGQSVAAAVIMTSEAWRLWDLRRVRHV